MKSAEQAKILLVEDDVNLGYLLVENLKLKSFEVTLMQTGKAAIEAINESAFDLCIIDIMLPELDGFSIAETLRMHGKDTPFIFLTARNQEQDKLRGFELGADDYITKPFSFRELHYRIMVALRRKRISSASQEDLIIDIGNVVLNPSQRTLIVNGQAKKLSHREAGLLQVLLEHKGRYVTRSEILKRVWGTDDYFTAKSMDVYITRIRKLLKDAPHLEVENLYGTGYRIEEQRSEEEHAA